MHAAPGHVPLVEVWRSGKLESIHYGSIAVCDTKGRLIFSRGDGQFPTYLRSSGKPFQAMTAVHLGAADRYQFTAAELAVMCASHGAQSLHLEAVASILAKCGASADQLGCGPHPPLHEPAMEELYRSGGKPQRLHNNCSGKHAGMLASCLHKGWPTANYFEPSHPLQEAIAACMYAFAGVTGNTHTGVDGCGVPTFFMTLAQAATAYARLANAGTRPDGWEDAATRIVAAMAAHPVHVSFEGQFGTFLLQKLGQHVTGKIGAEGVFCAGLIGRDVGIALKISDGNGRAINPVMVRLLEQFLHEVSVAELREASVKPIKNTRGQVVGELRLVNL
ncbi:MAG TPA: asparaginase [Gemmatales bacterium]|nr:asparaginase [Gemmatales bacterium]HMP61430.1 asparaginase [Gemmatales bacterium]